jgi:hypothetical protein
MVKASKITQKGQSGQGDTPSKQKITKAKSQSTSAKEEVATKSREVYHFTVKNDFDIYNFYKKQVNDEITDQQASQLSSELGNIKVYLVKNRVKKLSLLAQEDAKKLQKAAKVNL